MTTALSRLLLNRYTVLAFIAGAGLSAGVVALAAQNGGMGALHHGMMMSGDHVDHMLKHLYVEIDATDAQKSQIEPLVKQAMSDLAPLHAQAQSAHTQFFDALVTADRASLEAAREAHLQLVEQGSKRIVQLIADVDGILTPTQRQALANHLQKLHGMPGT